MSKCGRDFKNHRPGGAWVWAAGLILLCLGVRPAAGLSRQSPASAPTIARIVIRVDGQEAGPDYAALLSIKPGDPYDLKSVRDAVRQLYASGLFSDVRAERDGDQEVTLTFFMTKKLTVRFVNFQVPRRVSTSQLTSSLSALRPGQEFTEEKQARAEAEIKEFFKRQGYFSAEVRCQAVRDPQVPAVDLTFVVIAGTQYTVDQIHLKGESPIPLNELEKRMQTRPGRVYVPGILDRDRTALEEFFRSRGYQQARVDLDSAEFHEDQGTATLTLRLDPGEKVEILVRGAKVPLSLLTPIWQERVFEEWGLEEGEARILGYLRQKGRLFAIATSSAEHRDHILRVVYDVDPGARYRIRSLVFEGMTHFTVQQLRTLLGLQEGLFSYGIIDGQRVFELPGEMENLYRTRGFSEVSVNLDFYREAKSVTAILSVKEGPQERIQDVSIVGASQFSQDTFLAQVSSQPGAAFYQPNLQRDIETLKTFYLNQGFRETVVSVSAQKVSQGLYSVLFSVDEGQKFKVAKIIITGLKVTHKNTVLRELAIREGEDARQTAILDTKRNLERLGIFGQVELEEAPAEPGSINLVLRLQEAERHYAGLGLGLETAQGPQGLALRTSEVSPRLTAEYILSNIFGDASQFSVAGQFSLREKRGVVALEQRYLFGLAIQNSVSGLLERVDLPSFEFDRRGLSFNIVKPIYRDWVLMTTLQWARTMIVSLSIAPNEIDREFYPYSKTSIAAIVSRDRRDDPYNPVRGSFFSLAVEWAYPLFGVESDFQKIFFKYQRYAPLASRVDLSLTFRLGLGRGRMPIHERFFAGGSNSFRGEHFDELGPRDLQSDQPVGGRLLTLLNLELTVPFLVAVENLSWVFFYDLGNVFLSRSDFRLTNLENALGFGLRYRTPLGPLRLEVGLNLNAPGAGRKVIPFITIGNLF